MMATQPRSSSIFAWLGRSLELEQNYVEAWRYLKHAITPEQPAETKVAVWRAAGRSALEAAAYEDALRPLEIVLQVEDNEFRKAETNYFLARAHFELKDPERARESAEACLGFKPQGDLNAQARLLLGDISMSQGDPNTAAKHYVPVIEFYGKNPEIMERALRRAVNALELKGDEESLKAANRYRESLENLTRKPAAGSQ
jgi:tetratricopeptide (TPR) repeat protein